jgi:hypothetical protein
VTFALPRLKRPGTVAVTSTPGPAVRP